MLNIDSYIFTYILYFFINSFNNFLTILQSLCNDSLTILPLAKDSLTILLRFSGIRLTTFHDDSTITVWRYASYRCHILYNFFYYNLKYFTRVVISLNLHAIHAYSWKSLFRFLSLTVDVQALIARRFTASADHSTQLLQLQTSSYRITGCTCVEFHVLIPRFQLSMFNRLIIITKVFLFGINKRMQELPGNSRFPVIGFYLYFHAIGTRITRN